MKQKTLLFSWLLAMLFSIVGASPAWGDEYELVTSAPSDWSGDYVIVNTLSTSASTWLTDGTITGNKFSTADAVKTLSQAGITFDSGNKKLTGVTDSYVLHVEPSGNTGKYYITLKGANTIIYLIGNNTKSSSSISTTTVTANAEWSFGGLGAGGNVYIIGESGRYIGWNSSYFRAYASSNKDTYFAYLFKKVVSVTSLSVKTAPTKTEYKVGETLDLSGLVLDADGSDISTGYTASPANGATLSEAGNKTVTLTYGGKSVNQTIYVGSLTSIAIKTAPTKTTYDEGQTFDPTGMVLRATYDTGEGHTWTEDVTSGYTCSPSTALTTENTSVTISYGGQTANQTITVNAGVPYTVTFNAGTGSCGTASLTEASFGAGVTLPTATIGVTGWSFAGWATVAATNTEDEPTLYEAGDTYNPTDNITLYAVYKFGYKSETTFIRATSESDITSADKVVIAYNDGKVLNTNINLSTTLSETSGKVTPNSNAIFTLSGDNTKGYTLTNGTNTIGTSGSGSSLNIALSSTNNLWTFSSSNYTTNVFHVNNVNASGKSLEVYNSAWKAYALTTNGQAWSMRVYVPATDYVYNSYPATIVNPTIAWTTAGDKSLYLQDEASFTNAANVTGIAKTPVYTSSDATVATVSEAGVVTALKTGSTTITAKVAKEVGVNTEASVTYDVTVKDAKTIAGLKAITSTSTVVTFTADLTDAVVTYVKGGHAFIQDASGAVYASCGSSLTAGNKINGAVSGSIKAANQIDEITAIDLSDATKTDGDIPAAQVKTAAQLVANKADLEGKLVSITGATVTASLTSGSASGGKISDDGKTTEINLYAPDSNIEALKDAEGTFNGYITLYGGSTIRFNIFEQSQITLTKNAPTDQPLEFASDAIELDEETSEFTAFTGQVVSGAQGAVTYSIDSNDDGVVTSINSSTGAIVLSGDCGTATIKASAAAKEVTEAGVTTPYKATMKTYTITVRPRYSVSFWMNGKDTVIREASYGAGVEVPTPDDIADYKFQGWSTATVAATDSKPASLTDLDATIYPENNSGVYYAVYAYEEGTPLVEHTSTFTVKQASAPSSPFVSDGSSWTWSNVTFQDDNGAKINDTNGSVSFTLPSGGKAVSLTITKTDNTWAGAAAVVLKDASNNTLNTFSLGSNTSATYNFTSTYDHSTSYTLTNTTSKNAWTNNIEFKYTTGGVVIKGYTTTVVTETSVTITPAKYATFSSARPTDFSSTGITVYKAKVDGSVVKLTEIDGGIVPANTGVILYKDVNTNTVINVPFTAPEDALDNNELVATVDRTLVKKTDDDINYNYILQSNGAGGIVFNMATEGGAYMPAGRAYLSTTVDASASGARFAVVIESGETTGINSIDNVEKSIDNNGWYSLGGQKLNSKPSTKGIYIVNGRKVVVK